ncbi:MAG: response regulator [Candidatus Omnitrophota bacterium]
MDEKSKRSVLIVDDDVQQLELLAIKLSAENWRLVVAQSGEEALHRIMIEKPGLVILDILMPGMSGFETLKRIKEIDSNIPVVIVSAIWDVEESGRCADAGSCDYVTKPVDFERLKSIVLSNFLVD